MKMKSSICFFILFHSLFFLHITSSVKSILQTVILVMVGQPKQNHSPAGGGFDGGGGGGGLRCAQCSWFIRDGVRTLSLSSHSDEIIFQQMLVLMVR